jgi:BirA family transcriptional regulator, biotin operon repressor / biotin---[acetyl-CoA-carboxylase] ligase
MLTIQKELADYSIDCAKKVLVDCLTEEFVAKKQDFMTNFLEKLKIEWFDEILSTNMYLFSLNDQSIYNQRQITLCSAWSQTAGQGTHQRRWLNQPYQGLFFSLAFELPVLKYGFSLIIGHAVVKALHDAFNCPAGTFLMKWPNDIYYQQKKLGGILIQSRHQSQGVYIVLGVGLNLMPFKNTLNSEIQPRDLEYADLSDLLAKQNARFYFQLFAKLIQSIWQNIHDFEKNDLVNYIDEIDKILCHPHMMPKDENGLQTLMFTHQGEKLKVLECQLLKQGFLQVLTEQQTVLVLK